ncbi:MAG TPA: sigma-70 family RNA polymerase sigma factor [Nitrosomonas europaea]|nr:sigma-70 family RNA polymerase sigma factor [Nitrosomonas europaea]
MSISESELSSTHDIDLLYNDHHHWLLNWLRKKLGCPHHAADLAHDTFVKIMLKPVHGGLHTPRAYLTTIAHGLVVDHIRRKELEYAYLEIITSLPEPKIPSPETRLILLETLIRIDILLTGLNPKARSAFLMSRLDGLSHAEIAVCLGTSVSSVEKYIATALHHCYRVNRSVI